MSEQRVPGDLLPVLYGRDDVPVAESPAAPDRDDGDVLLTLLVHGPCVDRVHRRAVGNRNVDAEVERASLGPVPRVSDVAADGMLAIEGLDRPTVRIAPRHRPKASRSSNAQPRSCGGPT